MNDPRRDPFPTRAPRDPDERPSEDDLAQASLGIRGVPGADPAKMTPQREKKTPPHREHPPEHTD
jgi:hypothetical protein